MILYKLQPQPWLSKFPLLIEFIIIYHIRGLPGSSEDKESACNAGDPGSISGSGRSSAEGNGYPTGSFTLDIFFDKVKSLMYFPYLKIYFTQTGHIMISTPQISPCLSNITQCYLLFL